MNFSQIIKNAVIAICGYNNLFFHPIRDGSLEWVLTHFDENNFSTLFAMFY